MSMEVEQTEQTEHAEAQVAAAPEAETQAETEEGEYKIGEQAFKTSAEAFKYANELVYKNAITEAEANAYRQAVSDAANLRGDSQKVTQPVAEEEDNFDQKFYENPKAYLKELSEKVRNETKQEVLSQLSQQSEDDKLWGEFFKQNPDLDGFREDCDLMLGKYQKDIKAINQTKGQKAAMDYLAQKTRAKFQSYAEASKPRKELHRTSSGPSFGSSVNVTRNAPEEQDVDFATQIRNMRNKRA